MVPGFELVEGPDFLSIWYKDLLEVMILCGVTAYFE
jgi:hypothetical protein